MVFLVQLKDKPNILMVINATSRLDAFTHAKLIDTPKHTWCLDNFNQRPMTKSIQVFELK